MKPNTDKSRELARAGICRVLGKHREVGGRVSEDQSLIAWEDGAAERYRMMLFSDGEEVFVRMRTNRMWLFSDPFDVGA